MSDNIKPNEWINAKEAFNPTLEPKKEPAIDKAVSEIVGKPIRVNDQRLVNLVVKYKKRRKGDEDEPDNFLQNEAFIKELKEKLC